MSLQQMLQERLASKRAVPQAPLIPPADPDLMDDAQNPGPMWWLDGGNTFNDADAVQVADNSELPYGDAKLTGDQSKAIAYYRRGLGANNTLADSKFATALTQFSDSFAGNFGGVGRMFQDADYQVAKRAADEFLSAILRKDTGATITNQEFEIYGPMYLPMPGDKPELLEAKAKARDEALIAIEMGLGTAAPLAEAARQELAPASTEAMSDEELLRALQGGG